MVVALAPLRPRTRCLHKRRQISAIGRKVRTPPVPGPTFGSEMDLGNAKGMQIVREVWHEAAMAHDALTSRKCRRLFRD